MYSMMGHMQQMCDELPQRFVKGFYLYRLSYKTHSGKNK